ncbi:M23 family metallopeptidase [Treponema sp.]
MVIAGTSILIFILSLTFIMVTSLNGLSAASIPASLDPLHSQAMRKYSQFGSDFETIVVDEGQNIDLSETFSWNSYTVKRGDSVSQIALDHGLSLDSIIALNGVTNVKRLQAGSALRIPNMDGIPYTVKKGDSLARIASTSGIPMEAILDANDLSTDVLSPGAVLFLPGVRMRGDELKKALGELFIYPLRGKLTSPFGWRNDPFTGARRFHAAIDISASVGSSVRAAMDGRVSSVGSNAVYGNYLILSHSGSYQTMYAHLSGYRVNKGDRVLQGQSIAASGNTGYSTGPHLHFAVYKNGRALNPSQFLE